MSSLIDGISAAIVRQENVNPQYNNPGAIMDVDYYRSTGGQFRLQQYPTLEAGVNALKSLVGKYIDRGETLESFFQKYAPSGHGGNNPTVYAGNVATWLGIPTNVRLRDLVSGYVLPANFLQGQQLTPKLLLALGKSRAGAVES